MINKLEDTYLEAKIAYYKGTPIMSDAEFDSIEEELRKAGSRVIEQVGFKNKDFDFKHPSKMLSLAKIQTDKDQTGNIDFKVDEFMKWYNKNTSKLNTNGVDTLISSPKFDGIAVNAIYTGGQLYKILTRGDGDKGKDITSKLSHIIDHSVTVDGYNLDEDDIIEIRFECVIDKSLFNEKYSKLFANPRNYVAGLINKDDIDLSKILELTLLPVHFILNGESISYSKFGNNKVIGNIYFSEFNVSDFKNEISKYDKNREEFTYQTDGVVISFDNEYRKILGENEHDPEWSLAIKLVPEEVTSKVIDVSWTISKRGEIFPIVNIEPVTLAGSTVKKASGYNMAFISKNNIAKGAVVSLVKAGDIVPEIKSVITQSEKPIISPDSCPFCGSYLRFNNVHLICTNLNCEGKIAKRLATAIKVIDLKNIGDKKIAPFAKDFTNLIEIIKWVLSNGESVDTEKYGIKRGTRSYEIFLNSFRNIKSLDYAQVIQIIGYDNVGKSISKQIANEHNGIDPDYSGLEKALVNKLRTEEIKQYIKNSVKELEDLGIRIIRPKIIVSENIVNICMTGSPKNFGFKTKKDFISNLNMNVKESKLDKECNFLVTDSYESSSSKMAKAKKLGVEIITYGDLYNKML